MTNILVIDDDQAVLNYLKILLMQAGKFKIHTLQNSTKAFETIKNGNFNILLLDMHMPKINGLDILRYINENNFNLIPIVLTGVEDIDLAISAMKLGTFDYLLKPIEEAKLLDSLDKAIENIEFDQKNKKDIKVDLINHLKHNEVFKDIITQDDNLFKIFYYIEKIAPSDNSVLIWGESGTGKELIAQAIHKTSNRKNNKFVVINAGAFANELFSSHFFGYDKGAFTGADFDKEGFIEEADTGTLFLDEIGELSLPIQVKLLRFLQEGEFYRLGSTKNRSSNIRIIAATNKNLFEEIHKGNFRKDLFFRLNINSIFLPPLRERKGDIKLLSYYFLEKFNKIHDKNIKKISKNVLQLLNNYSYPGNIRELMNIINSSVIVESENELQKKSLPHYFLEFSYSNTSNNFDQIPQSLQEMEKIHIKKVLEYVNWNNTHAAKILRISRVNLISKIKKYNLK